jgi:hypothetical protein
MYYYILNKDEDMARKFSVDMTNKFVSEFCPERGLKVKTHKQLNDHLMHNLYATHKDLIYNRELPIMILNYYQTNFLKRLVNVDSLTNEELNDFLLSLELKNTPETRKGIIDYIIRAKNYEQATMVLNKPQIKVTREEFDQLKDVYGRKKIYRLIYGEFKLIEQTTETSK